MCRYAVENDHKTFSRTNPVVVRTNCPNGKFHHHFRKDPTMLALSRLAQEGLIIKAGDETIRVVVLKIKGHRVTLGVEADKKVKIVREELTSYK